MASVLRRELRLKSGEPIVTTIDAACHELGIGAEGTLYDRGVCCWQKIGCPAPDIDS